MVEMRSPAASQLAVLSLQSANFDKDALRGWKDARVVASAGVGRFVPDPVPTVPDPFQTRTTPGDPLPGEQAGSHIEVWS